MKKNHISQVSIALWLDFSPTFFFCFAFPFVMQQSSTVDLMIRSILLKHAGKYGCQAQTSADTVFAEAELLVRGELIIHLWSQQHSVAYFSTKPSLTWFTACGIMDITPQDLCTRRREEGELSNLKNRLNSTAHQNGPAGHSFISQEKLILCIALFWEMAL